MKKIIYLIVLLIGILCFDFSVYAMPYFADTIIDYGSGTGLDFTGDEHIFRALGEWDKVFVTIGETGYITLGFDNHFVTNEIGNDVRVYTTGHSILYEPGEIFASASGTSFFSIGILDPHRENVWVAQGPSYDIYFEEFDLNNSGLDFARYIKITDLPGGFVATDIDAVSILHNRAIPEPSTFFLFIIGFLVMGGSTKIAPAPIFRKMKRIKMMD